MTCEKDCSDRRQDSDVETKKSRERRSGDVVAASQESENRFSNKRNDSGDLSSDLGGKESELVPGKQVSAEAETDCEKQQEHAAQPGHLARLAISPHEINAEHMDEQRC